MAAFLAGHLKRETGISILIDRHKIRLSTDAAGSFRHFRLPKFLRIVSVFAQVGTRFGLNWREYQARAA
jgi:hypothetical protein